MDGRLKSQLLELLTAAFADNRVTRPGAIAMGERNRAQASYSSVPGGLRAKTSLYGQQSQANGRFTDDGDAQRSSLLARNITTDTSLTNLYLDGTAERLNLPNYTTWLYRVHIVARRTDATDESAAYDFFGCIDRQANAASTALAGAVSKNVVHEDDATWDANITADTTNGALLITVTGAAGKTIRWVAHVELTEVTNAA